MTYKEMKERERVKQTQHLGPGTYQGNDLNFGKGAKSGVIQPVRPKYVPLKRENNPGPGAYQPDKADKIVKAKAPVYKITSTEFRKSNTEREITPAPGSYDSHLKPFGSRTPKNVNLGPSGDPKPE